MPKAVLPENFIDSLARKDYQVLTILKIVEKTDPRFFTKFYDKGHDRYITPLEAEMPYGSPCSIDEQQESIQVKAQQILEFWNKPKLSYTLSVEKKYELKDDELRIRRIEKFREGDSSIETMHVVRLGEDSFFS